MLSCAGRAGGLLALLACFALSPPAAPAASMPQIGIADQKPDMFVDPRFSELRIRHARVAVSWDALRHPWQTAEVDRWMHGALARGVSPLVTFGHSRVSTFHLPTPTQLRREFRAFRARYPWAKTFATWNEVNHCGEKVCRRARLVASYYRALRRECRSCTLLAAEVIDLPKMVRWVRSFRRHLGYMPRLWGMHNYVEANRFRTSRLRQMLRLVGRRGRLWLTETGGLVRRTNKSTTDIPEGTRHAARVTRFLLDRVARRHRQIRRIYIYHWNAGPPTTTWDSALITFDGRERPAYRVLRRVMRRRSGS